MGTLLCFDRGHSSKWLSREKFFFLFQLNSNMLNILFAMGIFTYIKMVEMLSGNTYF